MVGSRRSGRTPLIAMLGPKGRLSSSQDPSEQSLFRDEPRGYEAAEGRHKRWEGGSLGERMPRLRPAAQSLRKAVRACACWPTMHVRPVVDQTWADGGGTN